MAAPPVIPDSGGRASHARDISPWAEGLRLGALKWRLLINTLSRSTWVLVGTIFGLLYMLFVLGMVVTALVALGGESVEVVVTASVLAGVALLLGWWLVPLVASRADATLDPSRLALFPLRPAGVQIGQLLGAVIGIPGMATAVALAAWLLAWRSSLPAVLAAAVCAVLGTLLTFTGSRCVTALSTSLSRSRRGGEIVSVVVLVVLVLLGPILTATGAGLAAVWEQLPVWAAALGWTPLGAVWALPADVAQGHWAAALGRLLITLVSTAVLVVVWRALLRRAMSDATGSAARSKGRSVDGAGLLDRLPATQWGAVTARCLIYWVKDPRYSASIAMIPAMGVLFWFTSRNGSGMIWILPAFVALLMAYAISADVSYDNTAFSLHLLAPVRGRADRLGRVLAMLVVACPLLLIAFVVWHLRVQELSRLPGMLGVSLSLLLAGAGVVSVLSARYTYPTPPPGASPLKTPQGFTFLNVILQFVVLGLVVVVSLPAVVLFVIQLSTGDMAWGWAALVVGVVEGLGLLWLGVVLGGKWLDARGPELLQEVAAYR